MRVALLTPWNQKCGNAEYAKKLAKGFGSLATIIPIELPNLDGQKNDFGRPLGRGSLYRHFTEILNKIEKSDVDIVHIQHDFVFFGCGFLRSNMAFYDFVARISKPVFISLHNIPINFSKKFNLKRWISQLYFLRGLKKANAIIVHSNFSQKLLIKRFRQLKKRTIVIPLPINRSVNCVTSCLIPKSQNKKWLMMVGFINRYKGHKYALKLLKELPANYQLVIAGGLHPKDIGAREYLVELMSAIDSLNIQDRVFITGFIQNPDEQSRLMKNADGFLLPYDEVGQSGSAVLSDVLGYDVPIFTSNAMSMFNYRYHKDTCFSSFSILNNDTNLESIALSIRNIIEKNEYKSSVNFLHHQNARSIFSIEHAVRKHLDVYGLKDADQLEFQQEGEI